MAPPIRLLHVLEATVGGTRRHLLDLCAGLPPDQFQQHLVYSSIRSADFEADARRLCELGIETTALPMRRSLEPVEDWHCLQALRTIIRAWRPAIVHGHSAKGGFLARLAARGGAAHTVYNPHGFAFQMRTNPLKHAFYLSLERYAARYTEAMVAVCEGQRALALEYELLSPERITVIHNGLAAMEQPACDRAAARRELGVPEAATVVGTIAALSPQKGIEYLVRAAALVRRVRPEVHFVIIGEGPLRGRLERLSRTLGLADTVHFTGALASASGLLSAFDLFVLPSLWEGLPYALLEAGAAGLPVVATDVAGNADLITPGVTGALARPAEAADLADQIIETLADSTRARQAAALQARVREDFTLAGMVCGHIALYERLAAR